MILPLNCYSKSRMKSKMKLLSSRFVLTNNLHPPPIYFRPSFILTKSNDSRERTRIIIISSYRIDNDDLRYLTTESDQQTSRVTINLIPSRCAVFLFFFFFSRPTPQPVNIYFRTNSRRVWILSNKYKFVINVINELHYISCREPL